MNERKRDDTGDQTEKAQQQDTDAQPDREEAAAPDAGSEATSEAREEPSPEEQIADLKDRLLRAMAETENIRRRSEREKAEAQKFGISRFARDLLSVADNLRRAIDAVPVDKREDLDEISRNLIAGVEMVERELLTTFERHGIAPLNPEKGTKFDPNLHQAMAEVPDSKAAPGTISDVFQPGYIIGDRLLRPAMVTVAKAETPAREGAADDEDSGEDAKAGSGG